jgi:hypothetical protein
MMAGRGLGRTHQQVLQDAVAQMDYEDAMAEARERQEFCKWQLATGRVTDMSTATVDDPAERSRRRPGPPPIGPSAQRTRSCCRRRAIWPVETAKAGDDRHRSGCGAGR